MKEKWQLKLQNAKRKNTTFWTKYKKILKRENRTTFNSICDRNTQAVALSLVTVSHLLFYAS